MRRAKGKEGRSTRAKENRRDLLGEEKWNNVESKSDWGRGYTVHCSKQHPVQNER